MFAMADICSGCRTERIARHGLGATVTTIFAATLLLMPTGATANQAPGNGSPETTTAQTAAEGPTQAPESPPRTPEVATTPATANLMAPVAGVPATATALDISPPAAGTQRRRASDTPIFEKWWFWTAITAVAVTTVIIVATSSGPSAPRTDLGNMVAF
jgi:hypothetical protein